MLINQKKLLTHTDLFLKKMIIAQPFIEGKGVSSLILFEEVSAVENYINAK